MYSRFNKKNRPTTPNRPYWSKKVSIWVGRIVLLILTISAFGGFMSSWDRMKNVSFHAPSWMVNFNVKTLTPTERPTDQVSDTRTPTPASTLPVTTPVVSTKSHLTTIKWTGKDTELAQLGQFKPAGYVKPANFLFSVNFGTTPGFLTVCSNRFYIAAQDGKGGAVYYVSEDLHNTDPNGFVYGKVYCFTIALLKDHTIGIVAERLANSSNPNDKFSDFWTKGNGEAFSAHDHFIYYRSRIK